MSKLIRNQQVIGSSPIAGSRFPQNFALLLSDPIAAASCWQHIGSNGRRFEFLAAVQVPNPRRFAQTHHIYAVDAGVLNSPIVVPLLARPSSSCRPAAGSAGEFWLAAGIAIHNDRIYVVDSANRRVQEFEYLKERP